MTGGKLNDGELFERGPVVVFKWRNAEGWPVEHVSLNALDTFGYGAEQFLSGEVSYASIVHRDDIERVAEEVRLATLATATSFEHEPYRVIHRDGSVRWLYDLTHLIRDGGEVSHFLGYVIDITARVEAERETRSLEHQLLQAQRLESLGMLAGGVAHDFNNILTGILGEAGLARRSAEALGHEEIGGGLERIERLALRAADLTRQLLAYSGKGRFVVLPLDLGDVIRDVATMLGVVISKKASLELDLGGGLPAIDGDRAQLQQIVMNLITNASDALGDDSGTIRITTRTKHVSDREMRESYGAAGRPSGSYVSLEVSDSGCGMTDDVLAHVFDPFFTTKAQGRGLGMSAIQGIVRSHSGGIRVTSIPGEGTCFELIFPASREAAIPIGTTRRKKGWLGHGVALIVDDEPSVLLVASQMMRRLGFETLTAADGQRAIEIYRKRRAEVSVVILDMMMPVMGGAEAVEALRRMSPTLPIVLSSGFDESEVTDIAARPAISFLQKPYQLSDVEGAVREALGPSSGVVDHHEGAAGATGG